MAHVAHAQVQAPTAPTPQKRDGRVRNRQGADQFSYVQRRRRRVCSLQRLGWGVPLVRQRALSAGAACSFAARLIRGVSAPARCSPSARAALSAESSLRNARSTCWRLLQPCSAAGATAMERLLPAKLRAYSSAAASPRGAARPEKTRGARRASSRSACSSAGSHSRSGRLPARRLRPVDLRAARRPEPL